MVNEGEETAVEVEEAGIFMWHVETDLVFGDSAVARVFGLDPDQVLKGLPLVKYVEKVHRDDRADLAGNITRAVDAGMPYNMDYRVIDENGEAQLVMAMGRCFRSQDGKPAYYAGIVYPVASL